MHYDEAMPSLQIRDMPEEIYEALDERAKKARRSLAQQAIVELGDVGLDEAASTRKEETISRLRARPHRRKALGKDAVAVVREDRER